MAKTLEGLTRTQLDTAESRDFALGPGPLRPRDAASLILLDRQDGEVRVLMGRRHARHAFMAGKFVFPGGRTDPDDARVAVRQGLRPEVAARLCGAAPRTSPARARAIALSAVRETYEEAGLLIGRRGAFATTRPAWSPFARQGIEPSLAGLCFFARAVTPPGRVRRYDTRFLAAWRSEIALELEGGGPTMELEELGWLPLPAAIDADVPTITRTILQELRARLGIDPQLSRDLPVPFYKMVRDRFVRSEI